MPIRNQLSVFLLLILSFQGNAQKEFEFLKDSIQKVINQSPTPQEKINQIFTNALYHDYAPFTKELLAQAKVIIDKNNLIEESIEYDLNMGQYYVYASNMDSAILLFESGLNKPFINDKIALKCELLSSLATGQFRNDRFKEAIINFTDALSILKFPTTRKAYIADADEEDALKMEAVINNNLGNLYKKIKSGNKAIKHYDDAIKIMLDLNAERYATTAMMNKASIYHDQGDFRKALEIHEETKALKIKSNATTRSIASSDRQIGIAKVELGEFKQAEELFENALATFESLRNTTGIVTTLTDRGLLNNKIEKYKEAIADCSRAKSLLLENNSVDYLNNCCECLFVAYKALGKHKEALINLECFKSQRDSILNEANFMKIGQAEIEYELEKKAAIKELSVNQERKVNKWIKISLLGLIIGLGSIIYLIYRNLKLKRSAERKLIQKNKIISEALADKDLLLREIHHRVKNNLQVISSLLSLQSKYTDDPNIETAIKEGKDRVKSMSLIHQNLYQKENLSGIDVNDYFTKLFSSLFASYNIHTDKVKLNLDIMDLNLDVDTIVPIGLIVNEMVSNSLKYAFPNERTGNIYVVLKEVNNEILLIVEDDGIGIADAETLSGSESFGYTLINSFKRKLEADLSINSENGTKVTMTIKKYKKVA